MTYTINGGTELAGQGSGNATDLYSRDTLTGYAMYWRISWVSSVSPGKF
jgi:hypothetical protein